MDRSELIPLVIDFLHVPPGIALDQCANPAPAHGVTGLPIQWLAREAVVALMTDRPHVVLIVDDDHAVRDALQFALRLEGFVVQAYGSGGELLAEKELLRATCVVIDEKMPGMDGFELLRLLRARHITLPSILITSHMTARLKARAAAAGIRAVLEKPLLDNVLTESVLAILDQRTQRCSGQAG